MAPTLAKDKFEVGGAAMSQRWVGCRVEHTHGFCTPFNLFYYKKQEMALLSEDVRESYSKEVDP